VYAIGVISGVYILGLIPMGLSKGGSRKKKSLNAITLMP